MPHDVASVLLLLQPRKAQNNLPLWLGQSAQAFFLNSLQRLNPHLSAAVHDGSGLKPFTTSNLLGMDDGIQPDQPLQLRFTTLHPHLTTLMLNGLVPIWCAEGVSLHDQPLTVTGVQIESHENPWCGVDTYAQLLQPSHSDQSRISFTFASPTAFKATAGHFVPLPQPELVFSSLIDRWNAFAPTRLPQTLYDVIRGGVAIESLDIQTAEISLSRGLRGTIIGFTGNVTYYLIERDREARRLLHTLAAFAKYSGVGVKTTVGLGQVRCVA